MNKNSLFNELLKKLSEEISLLKDKPEETFDSTLKALWFMAAGIPVSAEKAQSMDLPILSATQEKVLHELVEQRITKVPLAHLTGRQNFMGLEFICDSRALIPRKETEVLGSYVVNLAKSITSSNDNIQIMDICCGCGNLSLAVANEITNSKVYASDISEEAIELAKENAINLNLDKKVLFEAGDLFSSFENKNLNNSIDIISCNPPYISSAKVKNMDAEIASHEPILAFDGGMIGFKIIQRLIAESPKFLKNNGWLVFEVGLGQGDFIKQLCEKSGNYSKITSVTDNSENIRCIAVQK